jgi:hypothetical protein
LPHDATPAAAYAISLSLLSIIFDDYAIFFPFAFIIFADAFASHDCFSFFVISPLSIISPAFMPFSFFFARHFHTLLTLSSIFFFFAVTFAISFFAFHRFSIFDSFRYFISDDTPLSFHLRFSLSPLLLSPLFFAAFSTFLRFRLTPSLLLIFAAFAISISPHFISPIIFFYITCFY